MRLPTGLSSLLAEANESDLRELDSLTTELEHRYEVEKCLAGATVDGLYIPGPLYWLRFVMGDSGGGPGIETFDEKWRDKGSAPYPRFPGPDTHPYLPWLFNLFVDHRRVFLPKSREMMASWCGIGFAVWSCQFFEKTRAIVQTQKDDKVIDLIKGSEVPGYSRTLIERQPKWLQERFPLTKPMKDQTQNEIAWANGSVIQGVPRGADQIRQYHPTLVLFDEAAHLDEFQAAYGSADLVASKCFWMNSTPMRAIWQPNRF